MTDVSSIFDELRAATAPKTSTCSTCKATKPLDLFSRDRRTRTSRCYECKACESARGRERRANTDPPTCPTHLPVDVLRTAFAGPVLEHAMKRRVLFGSPMNDDMHRVQAEAEMFGVSTKTVQRWNAGVATLQLTTAERIADRLGRHPVEIWGAEYYALFDDGDELEAVAS